MWEWEIRDVTEYIAQVSLFNKTLHEELKFLSV